MVDLVNVLVKALVVHEAVDEVVPHVLKEEEEADLHGGNGLAGLRVEKGKSEGDEPGEPSHGRTRGREAPRSSCRQR